MKPEFERELNAAAARLTDWEEVPVFNEYSASWRKGEAFSYGTPQFCTDRNALPELWERIEDWWEFDKALLKSVFPIGPVPDGWNCHKAQMTAEPHLHVIAALRACNAWTESLEEMYQNEIKQQTNEV